MEKLILENFRCFVDRVEIPLAPLTVLVGENSSGKSSLMAATRLAWDLSRRRAVLDFNEEPYLLGGYDQLATYRAGRTGGRAKSFSIGLEESNPAARRTSGRTPVCVEASFDEAGAQPHIYKICYSAGPYKVTIEAPGNEAAITVHAPSGKWQVSNEDASGRAPDATSFLQSWDEIAMRWLMQRRRKSPRSKPSNDEVEGLLELLQAPYYYSRGAGRPHAFAPVRSRPQRTYDPIKDSPDSEGAHIPMLLARTLGKGSGSISEVLRERLATFGEASGLFRDLSVRQLGKEGDPFQLLVNTFGTKRNLIDVGYGVSQILPILVEILTGPSGRTFLIQQPEVHLHPRAQAALATLFGQLVKERRCQLIVETHSDYFIDRIRLDVRDRATLPAKDMVLLYLESTTAGTKIHPLTFDESGNVVDVPQHYRSFFLEEQRRFFGIA